MTKFVSALCLFLMPLFLAAVETKAPVTLPLEEDGRKWVQVRDDDINGQGIIEFVLENEDDDNWTELVTIQYFRSETLDPKDLFHMFMTDLDQQTGDAKVSHLVLEEKNRDIMAQWSISGSPNDQNEIIRILGDGRTVVIIRYTSKPEKTTPKNVDAWKGIIQKASLKH